MHILLAYYPIPHHAGASGYHQLARQLRDQASAETVEVERLPRLPAPLRERLIRRARLEWYDEWELALELAAARRLLRHGGSVCHLLYGEDAFGHLGRIRSLARLRRSRLVASFHQPPATFEQVFGRPVALRQLDAVLALSHGQAAYLASRSGNDRVFVVPHGVDTDFYTPIDRGARDDFTCLFVGSWLRDFDTLRRVVRELSTDPRVRFELVSPGQDFSSFSNVVVRSGLSDEELRDAYRRADVLVLPLLDSTANNSLLEALACGLPIVTTAVGGVPDYVDESCAILVEPHDADSMCQAVEALVASEGRRRELGRGGRERALDLDWSRVAERVLAVYEEIA